MKKEITYNGEKLQIGYNMAVAVKFEQISGEAFDLSINSAKISNQMLLLWVAVKHFNKEWSVSLEDFEDNITYSESVELNSALTECITDFFKLPAKDKKENNDESKNA